MSLMSGRKSTRCEHFFLVVVLVLLLSACGSALDGSAATPGNSIPVVAAENFYGDIARQVGGSHVSVTSILSDANVDPHEYESNVQHATLIAKAKLVITNGGGYDSWMDKLLASTQSPNRIVLKGFDLATVKLSGNEHIWYSIENAQVIARAIAERLKQLDAANAASYESNLHQFQLALEPVRQKISELQTTYANTPVALTEPVFMYQAAALGLHVMTPSSFQQAIDEGNDPSAKALAAAETQMKQKRVNVLIYNQQKATPITVRLRKTAQAQHIPVVSVTELMPSDKNYQAWMFEQLVALQQALSQSAHSGS
ncbi:MAG: zinc ABC transporter substrate-binding protein [Ktedonobacteraceae bacterium]|nr:zinc ABC transporter substrate-binding protein [Ktedonobacteraceae bacterium]